MSIPQPLLRDEIPRNEAYQEVRRSASGPEGRGMRVTQPFDPAQGLEPAELQMGVFRHPQDRPGPIGYVRWTRHILHLQGEYLPREGLSR
jgi:hypothetical protein